MNSFDPDDEPCRDPDAAPVPPPADAELVGLDAWGAVRLLDTRTAVIRDQVLSIGMADVDKVAALVRAVDHYLKGDFKVPAWAVAELRQHADALDWADVTMPAIDDVVHHLYGIRDIVQRLLQGGGPPTEGMRLLDGAIGRMSQAARPTLYYGANPQLDENGQARPDRFRQPAQPAQPAQPSLDFTRTVASGCALTGPPVQHSSGFDDSDIVDAEIVEDGQ